MEGNDLPYQDIAKSMELYFILVLYQRIYSFWKIKIGNQFQSANNKHINSGLIGSESCNKISKNMKNNFL